MPTGTPSYFTVDRFGAITANFSGVIVAAPGSTVPASSVTGLLTDAQLAAIAAAKVTGQLTDAQLAAIGAAKITGQLTDAQLAALSAAKITGQLTDAQILAIAAAKITGQLSDAQIAAISSTKLVGQITTTQITPGAITTGLLAANAVVANIIAANSIDGSKINIPCVEAVGGIPNPITSNNRVSYTRASDGAVVGAIYCYNNIGVQVGVTLRSLGLSKQVAEVVADNTASGLARMRTTLDDTVFPPAGKVEVEAQDGAGGTDWLLTVIDSKGRSNYLETLSLAATSQGGGSLGTITATPSPTKSAMGLVVGTWPGGTGSVYTNWFAFPFAAATFFAVIGTAMIPDGINGFVVNAISDGTNQRFKFIIQSPFGTIPPVGQAINISWICWGV